MIEDDVDIGVGAIILPGVTIGCGAQIGAGAVVTQTSPLRNCGRKPRACPPDTRPVNNPDRPGQWAAIILLLGYMLTLSRGLLSLTPVNWLSSVRVWSWTPPGRPLYTLILGIVSWAFADDALVAMTAVSAVHSLHTTIM